MVGLYQQFIHGILAALPIGYILKQGIKQRDDVRPCLCNKVLDLIEGHIVKSFKRRHMSEFEYLKEAIEPPTWCIVLSVVLSVLASAGICINAHKF